MEFGVFLPTKANSWAVVQRAEELGFTYAWFYDTQILSADLLVAMGATAMKTSRIKLCAGVFIPSNRVEVCVPRCRPFVCECHTISTVPRFQLPPRFAPVAANALATLNALAPGRVVFGTSTGYTGRRTLCLGPATLARLEAYVRVVDEASKRCTAADFIPRFDNVWPLT